MKNLGVIPLKKVETQPRLFTDAILEANEKETGKKGTLSDLVKSKRNVANVANLDTVLPVVRVRAALDSQISQRAAAIDDKTAASVVGCCHVIHDCRY